MVTIVSHLQGPESSVSSLFKIDINQRRLVAPPARQERHSLDTGHGHDSNRIAFQEKLAFKKGLVYVQDRWQTRAASQQTPHSKIRYHHWHASPLTASAEEWSMSTVQSPNDRSSCKFWISTLIDNSTAFKIEQSLHCLPHLFVQILHGPKRFWHSTPFRGWSHRFKKSDNPRSLWSDLSNPQPRVKLCNAFSVAQS